MTLTNVLYDLAAHPEYIEVLREEISRVSAEEPNGQLRKKTMPKLRKLDSFIKESQRINPLGAGKVIQACDAYIKTLTFRHANTIMQPCCPGL